MTSNYLEDLVRTALREDLGPAGDVTTSLVVPSNSQGTAQISARQDLVLSGLSAAAETMRQTDERIFLIPLAKEGERVARGRHVASLEGPSASILAAERTALNFLMLLSGVATLTARFADLCGPDGPKVLDTRKTAPGLRFLQKAAVRHGGGHNHRFGLSDGILIKDNHIRALGSIRAAVEKAKAGAPHGLKVEVEAESLAEVREALTAGADIILLDNMGPELLREAVALADSFFAPHRRRVLLEASGGIDLSRAAEIARTGVDFLSIGALTHSAPAADLGLDWD
jgi:nicotinate-nucleotide pyrophosphorylase (carboxylating)